MPTNVYVDGFNLYYGCLRGTPYKWLDLDALCRRLFPRDRINRIRYFTAIVSARPGDPQQPQRQQAYLRALQTIPGLTIHRGRYLTHPTRMLLAHPVPGGPVKASMRGHLADGCGVLLPIDGGVDPGIGCSLNASQYPAGIDPATGEPPAGRVVDQSSSSPTVAPDGSVIYGAYSRYNFARGHTFKFSSGGAFQGTFDFGWGTTPAIYQYAGTYSIVIKDNHYDANCCPTAAAPPPGPYFITQLSAGLSVEWKFKTISTGPDNPNGFEWCINAPAIDANGVVYDNSKDGNVYAIDQGGTLKQRMFLRTAIGAAYTPLAIAADGKLYTETATSS